MGKLDGKVAVITGAGRGIGKADAILLAKEGAAVVVGDIDEAPITETAREIQAAGGKAVGCVCDVTKSEDCQKMMDLAVEKFGKLDILVNNAGLTRDAMIHKMTDAQWDSCININLRGPFNCIRAASKYMMQEGHNGKIINVSSLTGLSGQIGQINYAAAKAGVIGLTKTVAKEWKRYGICCNCICYAAVDTRMTKAREEQDEVVDGQALGIPQKVRDVIFATAWVMQPEDAAKPVLFFASDDASYITGAVLNATGGEYM